MKKGMKKKRRFKPNKFILDWGVYFLSIIILHLFELFAPALANGVCLKFVWEQGPQLSSSHLSILANLNNAIVWMVTTGLLIFESSSPCINSLLTVPSAPFTIGNTVTFIFYSFFIPWLGIIMYYLSVCFLSILLCGLFIITGSGRLAEIRWSTCISESQRCLCVSFSRIDSELFIYHFFRSLNVNFFFICEFFTPSLAEGFPQ